MQLRLVLLSLSVELLAVAGQPSVREVNGNIILVLQDGSTQPLTASGGDSMPAIAPDGRRVVFVRSDRPDKPDDLCLISVDKPPAQAQCDALTRALSRVSVPSSAPLPESGKISDPQFSADSSAVYLFIQPGNLGLIVRLDLGSLRATVVSHSVIPIQQGRFFDVIPHGKYGGDLVVYKDSEKLTAGRLFLYWLTDSNGANLAIIADKEADLELFRAEIGIAAPN